MKSFKRLPILTGTILAALIFTACAATETNETPPEAETEKITETPETEEVTETVAEVTWERFTDPRIEFSFEVPETWRVEDNGGDPAQGIFEFEVYDDEDERQLYYLSALYSSWSGEDCPADSAQMQISEYDVTPIPLYEGAEEEGLRFAYRIAQAEGEPVLGSVAVLSGPETPDGSCVVANVSEAYGPTMFADMHRINFINSERYDREFDTLEEAEEFTQTELYKTLKKIILSLEMNQ